MKRMREEVSNELAEVINEFGPQMFEDFNEVSVQLCILGTICLTSCSGASSFLQRAFQPLTKNHLVSGDARAELAESMLKETC